MKYIPRIISGKIIEAAEYYRVLVITGPRQSGKSTLCRHLYPDYKYVNLENIVSRAAAGTDPAGFLESLGDHAIIDEVQHVPELLSMVQVRVDEDRRYRYVLTGSSNFSLLKTVTQSLAGRAALFTLLPLSFKEFPSESLARPTEDLVWQGEYPGVIAEGIPPDLFYRNYYNTYVDRDLRDLLKVKNILNFDKFIRLLATRTGSEFNASALAREVGVSANTISEWMSLLSTSYIAYPLRPYFVNTSKRLTKMPKVYFYDTGLLCYLLSIDSPEALVTHPMRGAVFENLAIGELLKGRLNAGLDPNIYFYRETSGREADALIVSSEGIRLYEVKAGHTLRGEYLTNMKDIAATLGNVVEKTVIYDGESMPPVALNIRTV